jgi:hypothetical protein
MVLQEALATCHTWQLKSCSVMFEEVCRIPFIDKNSDDDTGSNPPMSRQVLKSAGPRCCVV